MNDISAHHFTTRYPHELQQTLLELDMQLEALEPIPPTDVQWKGLKTTFEPISSHDISSLDHYHASPIPPSPALSSTSLFTASTVAAQSPESFYIADDYVFKKKPSLSSLYSTQESHASRSNTGTTTHSEGMDKTLETHTNNSTLSSSASVSFPPTASDPIPKLPLHSQWNNISFSEEVDPNRTLTRNMSAPVKTTDMLMPAMPLRSRSLVQSTWIPTRTTSMSLYTKHKIDQLRSSTVTLVVPHQEQSLLSVSDVTQAIPTGLQYVKEQEQMKKSDSLNSEFSLLDTLNITLAQFGLSNIAEEEKEKEQQHVGMDNKDTMVVETVSPTTISLSHIEPNTPVAQAHGEHIPRPPSLSAVSSNSHSLSSSSIANIQAPRRIESVHPNDPMIPLFPRPVPPTRRAILPPQKSFDKDHPHMVNANIANLNYRKSSIHQDPNELKGLQDAFFGRTELSPLQEEEDSHVEEEEVVSPTGSMNRLQRAARRILHRDRTEQAKVKKTLRKKSTKKSNNPFISSSSSSSKNSWMSRKSRKKSSKKHHQHPSHNSSFTSTSSLSSTESGKGRKMKKSLPATINTKRTSTTLTSESSFCSYTSRKAPMSPMTASSISSNYSSHWTSTSGSPVTSPDACDVQHTMKSKKKEPKFGLKFFKKFI